MKSICVLLGLVFAFSSFAEVTCGEVKSFKPKRNDLSIEFQLKSPQVVEALIAHEDTFRFAKPLLKKQAFVLHFQTLEAYALQSLADQGMVEGIKALYKKAYLCTQSDSNKLGIGKSNVDAAFDLLKH